MLRVIKFLSLCGLVVVVVGGVWIATHDLDLSGWRPEVEQAVRASTGRALSVEGDLEVNLWPVPRIFASGLAFSNAAWGSRPDMLTAREVEISVQLVPLLKGEVNVHGIRMSGVDLIVSSTTRILRRLTQAEYDALNPPDQNTFYAIVG